MKLFAGLKFQAKEPRFEAMNATEDNVTSGSVPKGDMPNRRGTVKNLNKKCLHLDQKIKSTRPRVGFSFQREIGLCHKPPLTEIVWLMKSVCSHPQFSQSLGSLNRNRLLRSIVLRNTVNC